MNAWAVGAEGFGDPRWNAAMHSGPHIDPQADSNERTYAVFLHLTAALWFIIPVPIVPALIMWQIKKDTSPFLDDHGKEVVNFQLTMLLYGILFGLLSLIVIGIPFLIALPFFAVICAIVAAVKAGRGEFHRYPVTLRLIG
ncbi:MAG: DUF4870 domain-containing protein [Planctomycetota bacterium]|nr:DUF4870 domain-containing protein [Planctomycetota bacterium]